jgi:hypothetical protein
MVNGLRINISESDFKAKPVPDQNWVLYQALIKIDEFGCRWSATHYKETYWKKLTVLGGGFGAGFGFSILVGRLFHCW